jgi:malonyl-CoA/methylmalonyl-CoA synthetase
MFFGVPTIYNRLVALREDSLSEADLSSVRLWVSGSAPLTATTFERFRETFGYELMNRYGMTEVGFVIGTRLDERRRPGAIGRPFPGIQIRIVDPDRADEDELSDVHDGQVGEIVINGPNLFSGYWQKPEETKKAFLKGFVRSGDLAEREADGMIRIVGRRSVDIIKTRGFKISAVEIENCLQQHPSVMEVTVVGVPDPDLGEAVVAAVSAKPGSAVTPEAIQSYARAHLAPHKVPARVVLMTEIPRSGPGKFNKRELVDRLLAGV